MIPDVPGEIRIIVSFFCFTEGVTQNGASGRRAGQITLLLAARAAAGLTRGSARR